MGVYKNNNGTLTPIANETQFIAPVNEYVTKPELEAIVPSDTSADNKLTTVADVDTKINDVWKAQGELGVKNLLEYPYNMEGTAMSQNVSCTVNDDGSLSFTGVTTSNTVDFHVSDTKGKSFTLVQGEYILTGSSAYVTCFLFLRRTSDNTVEVSTTMNNTLLEIDSTTAERIKAGELKICIRVKVLANANLDGFKVYPMIRYSSDTDTTWHPYAFSNKEITERVRNARGIIKINASDGIEAFYEKMTQAFDSGNCDVYISKGDYIYTNTFVDSIRANNKRGVPVGNGCKYYFETGANLYCEYTGENKQDVVNLFSPLDTQSMGSDFEIYNLHLVSKNTVYAFHDEANAANNFCRHVYRNCYIELDNSNSEDTTYISKALGGGLGKYEEIIIENCVFKATNPNKPGLVQEDASYHGANRSTITDVSIIVTGCWFDGTFRTSDDSSATGPYPRIIYTGNSAAAAASIPNTWENHSWNNEIRV